MKHGRLVWFFLIGVLLCGALAFPTSAALNTVKQADTVFIGEQGLDITQALGGYSKIAWWEPGTNPQTEQPADVKSISEPTNFAVDTTFSGELNNWYRYNGGYAEGLAFYVKDPAADVTMLDLTNFDADVTNKSVRLGDLVDFKVQSDLYLIRNRDAASVFNFVIKVRAPGGNVYDALYTPSGLRMLTYLPLSSTPWYWSSYNGINSADAKSWETGAEDSEGNDRYATGTYTIWVECKQNNLNYVSAQQTVQLYEDKLDLTVNASAIVRGNRTYTTITGVPNTWYLLWVKDCSGTMTGYDCNQPPLMTHPQTGVMFDTGELHFGDTLFDCSGCLKTVYDTVPHYPDNGIYYYALVLTDESGNRTVEWQTTTSTKPMVYTFRAQAYRDEYDPTITFVEKPLNVMKGEINFDTYVYGKQVNVAYLGDTVKISGINKDSRTTYLFISGPCQDCAGAALTYPNAAVVNNNPETFTQVPVKADGTWEYIWYTEFLKIDLGNYTIYAASKPNDKPSLENTPCNNCTSFTPSCAAWIKKPFTFLEPTLRGDVNPKVVNIECCRNTSIIVNGSSTGNEQVYPYVALWVFGENKVAGQKYVFTTIPVNCPEGTFRTDLSTLINTLKLETGIYTIVIQHPMYNHRFDIIPEDWIYDGVYSYEQNRKFVVTSSPVRWSKLFVIDGPDRLVGTDALNALLEGFNNPNVDDIDLVLKFKVENPNPMVADFSVVTTSGMAPFVVPFTDTSTGSPTSYLWNFGDNTTSTVQNPTHTYYTVGSYTVSLTISNGTVSTTTTKTNYITVTGPTPTPTPTPVPGSDTISLYTGWNFVSTPKTLADGKNTAGVVFAGVDTVGHSIFEYNALTHVWEPMAATSPVDPLNGIWIYSKNATTVKLTFRNNPLETPPTKQLWQGWNAIGSGETQTVTAQNALMTIQTAWAKLIGFNGATQSYDATIFNSAPSYQSSVYPTRGYWVFMSSDGIYS